MRLQLLSPPEPVAVEDGGSVLPALLLARRGDRRYVQVRRAPGISCLRWVDVGALRSAAEPCDAAPPVPERGLPWARRRQWR